MLTQLEVENTLKEKVNKNIEVNFDFKYKGSHFRNINCKCKTDDNVSLSELDTYLKEITGVKTCL